MFYGAICRRRRDISLCASEVALAADWTDEGAVSVELLIINIIIV